MDKDEEISQILAVIFVISAFAAAGTRQMFTTFERNLKDSYFMFTQIWRHQIDAIFNQEFTGGFLCNFSLSLFWKYFSCCSLKH